MKTIQKILMTFAVLAVCCVLLPGMTQQASAAAVIDSGACGDNVSYTLYDDSELVISGTGDMWNWGNGYTNNPYQPWNEYFNKIETVIIGESVTNIGNYAFCKIISYLGGTMRYDDSSIKSITIPGSVKSIGSSAFRGCSSMTSIIIPKGVTSIGNSAFEGCSVLTSITIPDSVTSIGEYAFEYCRGLTNIEVNSNNKNYCSINGNLFNKNKTELIQYAIGKKDTSYTIPDSVTSIDYYAFEDCSSLTSVTIPDSVTSIGYAAFQSCSGLTSVTIPNSVTSIGNSAFEDCSSLTSIIIPNSVTDMGNYAFSYCSNLTSAVIGEGVRSIASNTFSGCSKMTKAEIPISVTSILSGAFSGTGITDVYYRGTKSQWNAIAIASNNDVLDRATIHYETAMPEEPEIPAPPYRVTSLVLRGSGGILTAPPTSGGFLAEMSLLKTAQRSSKDHFILIAYDEKGAMLGANYAAANIPKDTEFSFGITFPAYNKPVKKIKAFVWDTLSGMTPLANAVER